MSIVCWGKQNKLRLLYIVTLAFLFVILFLNALQRYSISTYFDAVHNYLAPGYTFFAGNTSFADITHNNGFALLVGLVTYLSDTPELRTIVFGLVAPAMFAAVFLLFFLFESLSSSTVAFFSVSTFMCTHIFSRTVVRPLSEGCFLGFFSLMLFLVHKYQQKPFRLGLLAGCGFWVRNHMLLFLPFWPVLFTDVKTIPDFIRRGIKFGLGALPALLIYYVCKSGTTGYQVLYDTATGQNSAVAVDDFWRDFTAQLGRLGYDSFQIGIFTLALLSILIPPVRKKFWRLWIFVFATITIQVTLVSAAPGQITHRPTVFIVYLPIMSFLSVVSLSEVFSWVGSNLFGKLNLDPRRSEYAKSAFLLLLFAALLLPINWRMGRYLKNPANFSRAVYLCPYDFREIFQDIPENATVLVENGATMRMTSISFPYANYVSLSSRRGLPVHIRKKGVTHPVEETVAAINKLKTDPKADYLVMWRRLHDYPYPAVLQDESNKKYKLLNRGIAPQHTVALYKVMNASSQDMQKKM